MDKYRIASTAVAAMIGLSISGCASHLITSGLPDGSCAAGNCSAPQISIAGRSGVSSNGATGMVPAQCDGRPMTRVEVRRSVEQGLVTLLTLGIVNPATIHFSCAKSGQTSPITCETIEGTGGNGEPTQIRCTRHPDGDDSGTVQFDCTATSDPAAPERITAFSCAVADMSWLEGRGGSDRTGRG